jgi:hypothetical protein
MLLSLCLTLPFLSLAQSLAPERKLQNDYTLNRYPIIMSHDAATGEIVEERDHVVDDWAKTQSVGLVEQLNCGARSFGTTMFCDFGFTHILN